MKVIFNMNKLSMQNISVMNVQYWHYSFEYFLDSMEECGLHNIELWAGAPHFYYEDYSCPHDRTRAITALRKEIESRDMRIVMFTPEQLNYPVNIAGRDPAYRSRSIAYFMRHLEIAAEFGTERMFITSGWGLLDEPREESWKRSVDSLQQLSQKAESMGMKLVIEQLQPYESNLVTSCQDMQRLFNEVDSDALQCCVDVVAMAVVGDTLQDFFTSMEGKVTHIHFADGNPSGHYVWGEGNLPMMDYIHVLEENDYDGFLTLEINDAIYWDDPHCSIERTAHYLHEYLPGHN
ncbi:MAG TPA: xylose isomerase [Anaerolineaceae bacterium]|nr:xylose isomerase [Anaerolineaceae bacterium]